MNPATPDPQASAAPAPPERVELCASGDLLERGRAHLFPLLEHGLPALGFALRFEGRVVGYLNRCAHVPTEMDWRPGEFIDTTGNWIICSIHGALYEPGSGHCVSGPCAGRRLRALRVLEEDGRVWWQPEPPWMPAPDAPSAQPAP